MLTNMNNNLEKLIETIEKLENKESIIYFLVYDTKGNARASIKYIYDMALVLHENGYKVRMLSEDETYSGVESWLGEKYNELKTVSIKTDKVELYIEDVLVVPEYYSNVLEQISNVKSIKVMVAQQKSFLFDTLSVGSKWSDFGFDKCITTTNSFKKYIMEYFPETLVYVNSPYIDDIFSPTEKPRKPFIAISCRDRVKHRKLISEFYLKFPQLRWVAFRDMVQMTYEEFSETLKECMVSIWLDDESTFGTFPLESMKCDVPLIGKIPHSDPDWITPDNGFWVYDEDKMITLLGSFILNWLEGDDSIFKLDENNLLNSTKPFNKELFTDNTLSIFNSMISIRLESLKKSLEKSKTE